MSKQSRYGKLLKYIGITLCVGIMVGLFGHVFAPGKVHAENEVQRLWGEIDNLKKALEATQKATAPVGTILPYGGSEVPEGWFFCDGRALKREKYKDLYGVIGANFGAPDNNTFYLPDLRGRFVRGVDHGLGLDPDANKRTPAQTGGNSGDEVGSVQDDAFQGHYHVTDAINNVREGNWGSGAGSKPKGITASVTKPTDMPGMAPPRISSETRSKNIYVNWIIKAKAIQP